MTALFAERSGSPPCRALAAAVYPHRVDQTLAGRGTGTRVFPHAEIVTGFFSRFGRDDEAKVSDSRTAA